MKGGEAIQKKNYIFTHVKSCLVLYSSVICLLIESLFYSSISRHGRKGHVPSISMAWVQADTANSVASFPPFLQGFVLHDAFSGVGKSQEAFSFQFFFVDMGLEIGECMLS